MPDSKAELRRELQKAVINTGGSIVAQETDITDTRSLRMFLVGKMNAVAKGELDAAQTTGIANMAQQIYNTLNIELKTAVAMQKMENKKVEPVQFDE